MLSLILITQRPDVALFAIQSGVNRIMVDLEVLGKQERQGHLDTLISSHSISDVERLAQALDPGSLIVRTNPLNPAIEDEIESILEFLPGYVMLPMVRTAMQVAEFVDLVAGRSKVIPLVETAEGLSNIGEIAALPGVHELYIGLNDLHLDLGSPFIFEPLQNGLIDNAIEQVSRRSSIRYGFGGVARMEEGFIPGRLVLSEHVRLRSSLVILSRTFHRRQADGKSMANDAEFPREVQALRVEESRLRSAGAAELLENQGEFSRLVLERLAK